MRVFRPRARGARVEIHADARALCQCHQLVYQQQVRPKYFVPKIGAFCPHQIVPLCPPWCGGGIFLTRLSSRGNATLSCWEFGASTFGVGVAAVHCTFIVMVPLVLVHINTLPRRVLRSLARSLINVKPIVLAVLWYEEEVKMSSPPSGCQGGNGVEPQDRGAGGRIAPEDSPIVGTSIQACAVMLALSFRRLPNFLLYLVSIGS